MNVKGIFNLLGALLMLWFLALTIERLVWVNMASYPAWLAQTYTVPEAQASSRPEAELAFADAVCPPDRRGGGATEISRKANGLFIRCGFRMSLIPGHKTVWRIVTGSNG